MDLPIEPLSGKNALSINTCTYKVSVTLNMLSLAGLKRRLDEPLVELLSRELRGEAKKVSGTEL